MKLLLSLALTAVISLPQLATAATCPATLDLANDITRQATVIPSNVCATVDKNAQLSDINDAFAGTWEAVTGITADDAGNGALGIDITNGGWGQRGTAGEFSIVNQFWNYFDEAVISIHVGNGNQYDNPSSFMFIIDQGTTAGQFSTYCDESATGCGFSNLKLWGVATLGAGPMPPVPVPAAVWLFGSALLALGMFKRKRT